MRVNKISSIRVASVTKNKPAYVLPTAAPFSNELLPSINVSAPGSDTKITSPPHSGINHFLHSSANPTAPVRDISIAPIPLVDDEGAIVGDWAVVTGNEGFELRERLEILGRVEIYISKNG